LRCLLPRVLELLLAHPFLLLLPGHHRSGLVLRPRVTPRFLAPGLTTHRALRAAALGAPLLIPWTLLHTRPKFWNDVSMEAS
jgi:hypothetical protein